MTTPAIMFGLLTVPLLVTFVIGRLRGPAILDAPTAGCLGLALVLGFTGIGHFLKTEPMVAMLPPWVPAPTVLVYVSGVIELVLAVAVVVPRGREIAGWLITVMLVVFLPVNVFAAVNQVGMGGHQWGPAYLLIRVPLQLILIAWAYRFAIRPTGRRPVRFQCRAELQRPPREIAEKILDVAHWTEFEGYGVLPGIQEAVIETQPPDIVGTRFRVKNTDGSSHVEEIVEWDPERRVRLHMSDFSPPLSRMASGFDELWEFEVVDEKTRIVRSFALHPKTVATRPLLWGISFLLRGAIRHHLRQMRQQEQENEA